MAQKANITISAAGLLSSSFVAVLVLLVTALIPVPAASQQACSEDFSTPASLQAARATIEASAWDASLDVALSPAGCLRYRRSVDIAARRAREETIFDGQLVVSWDHLLTSTGRPNEPPSYAINSVGWRDNNGDGFGEWRAMVYRRLDGTFLYREAEELNRDTLQVNWRQIISGNRLSGTMHVRLEEGEGPSTLVTEYDAPIVVEAGEQIRTEESSNISVECPAGLREELIVLMTIAAANGGRCFQNVGMFGEAIEVQKAAVRPFQLVCEAGPTGRRAAIDLLRAYDTVAELQVTINTTQWTAMDSSFRERILFHEMLHIALDDIHHPALEGLRNTNDDRWRELDRVSSCTSLCYNPNPTRCECARCLRKRECTPPCDRLRECYSRTLSGICPCPSDRQRWYETIFECAGACSSGVECFGVQCIPEVNACRQVP